MTINAPSDPILICVWELMFNLIFLSFFFQQLRSNIVNNVKGAEYLLDLCHQFNNLAALVHVSTAYSFCDRLKIEEKVYPMDADYSAVEKILKLVTLISEFLIIIRILN